MSGVIYSSGMWVLGRAAESHGRRARRPSDNCRARYIFALGSAETGGYTVIHVFGCVDL